MTDQSDLETLAHDVQDSANESGTLVQVKFQKDPNREQKYLEAEPKILGVTQIMLSIFYMSLEIIQWNFPIFMRSQFANIVNMCLSSTSIVAGGLAITGENLRLPILKACLGMQVVACAFSLICFLDSTIITSSDYEIFMPGHCWTHNLNETVQSQVCDSALNTRNHITLIEMLLQATEIALSATLAAFCCKVIQCCSPRSNVPMIVVNTPPGPQ